MLIQGFDELSQDKENFGLILCLVAKIYYLELSQDIYIFFYHEEPNTPLRRSDIDISFIFTCLLI